MKTCKRCKRILGMEEFHNYPRARDGKRYWCKDCERVANVEWYRTPKGKVAAYRNRTSVAYRYALLRNNAKKRAISVEISREQYLELTDGKPCVYCGGPLGRSGSGLDRLDNAGSYTIWNSVPCCGFCNQAKSDRSARDFLQMCRTIAHRFPVPTP